MAELAEDFRQIAVVGGAIQLMVVAILGLIALRQSSRDDTPSDVAALVNPDTAEFPREHGSQHRRRPQSRSLPVRHRQPVCRARVPADQRNTVRVQVYDPPERGGLR